MLAGLALILGSAIRDVLAHKNGAAAEAEVLEELEGADDSMPGWRVGLYLVLGLVGLPLGADILVDNAQIIAKDYGCGDPSQFVRTGETVVDFEPRVVADEMLYASALATIRDGLTRVPRTGTASTAFTGFPLGEYPIAGKTGTADKPKPTGGYYEDKVINTFASIFPIDDPKYVLIVSLDEPSENSGDEPRRTAGWTAVPVAAEMIGRIAPLLGLRPDVEPGQLAGITLTSN